MILDQAKVGINTLFSIQNQMWNAGIIDFQNLTQGLTLLSYHLVLDFLEVLDRYSSSNYQWSFDQMEGVLTIDPPPSR